MWKACAGDASCAESSCVTECDTEAYRCLDQNDPVDLGQRVPTCEAEVTPKYHNTNPECCCSMLLGKSKSCKVCNKKTTADKGTSEVVTMSEARKLLSIACVHTCTPAACGMASSECDSLPKDILQAWSSLKWQCRSGIPILRQLCLPLASPQIECQQNLCKLLFGLELDPVEESIKTLGTTVFASMRGFPRIAVPWMRGSLRIAVPWMQICGDALKYTWFCLGLHTILCQHSMNCLLQIYRKWVICKKLSFSISMSVISAHPSATVFALGIAFTNIDKSNLTKNVGIVVKPSHQALWKNLSGGFLRCEGS